MMNCKEASHHNEGNHRDPLIRYACQCFADEQQSHRVQLASKYPYCIGTSLQKPAKAANPIDMIKPSFFPFQSPTIPARKMPGHDPSPVTVWIRFLTSFFDPQMRSICLVRVKSFSSLLFSYSKCRNRVFCMQSPHWLFPRRPNTKRQDSYKGKGCQWWKGN